MSSVLFPGIELKSFVSETDGHDVAGEGEERGRQPGGNLSKPFIIVANDGAK